MSQATFEDLEVASPESVAPTSPANQGFVFRPLAIEWIALAGTLIALVALALVRVGMTDTPYHLATARLAHESGHWPTTNTFSYTYPDYPLYQQYPVYQELLYRVHQWFGWAGLSVLHLAAYSILFLLWVAWSGGIRLAAVLSLPTMVLLLGLRERMVLRPDILTMAYFVLTLMAVDGIRKGRGWAAFSLPIISLLWVNSHQMFWLGLAIQGAFLVHVAAVRWFGGRLGIANDDRGISPWLPAGALGLSILSSLLSPIGLRILEVPFHTMGSLYFHREHVMEFRPFHESPQATWLVAVSAVLALIAFYLGRRRWQPFEWMVWCLGAAMVAGAIRGTPYFVALSVGLFAREIARLASRRKVEESVPIVVPFFAVRMVAAIVAIGLAFEVYWFRWIDPSRILGGSQFGVGRTLGEWPDEAMAFLQNNPPPGRMLNLGWYIGNPIVLELFPMQPVFVDPRFEAYPREFLLDAIHAESDPIVLDRLLDRYEPNWIVGELRIKGVRQQLARLLALGEWEVVFLDPICAVLVRTRPETAIYQREYRVDVDRIDPPGMLIGEPDLLALQQLRLSSFLAEIGHWNASKEWYRRALESSPRGFAVTQALSEILADHPELQSQALSLKP